MNLFVLAPDHGEECGDVLGQVDVQQEVVLHLVQQLEALPVPRVVKALDHLAQLRLKLQKQLKIHSYRYHIIHNSDLDPDPYGFASWDTSWRRIRIENADQDSGDKRCRKVAKKC